MTYAVYTDFTNRIARYHETGCPRIRRGSTRSGGWRHDILDVETIYRDSWQYGVKVVVPADCCLEGSTEAKCIGCRSG